ncbi:hypothetical protein JB92DRAFT_2750665, partial [Gautieria morchelliformis]
SQACDLQDCLGKNTYSEKCDSYMRKLYECCQQMYASNEAAESTPCPMRSVVKRWPEENSSGKGRPQ